MALLSSLPVSRLSYRMFARESCACPEGISGAQYRETLRVYEVTRGALEEEAWRMACSMASKESGRMLRDAEFESRTMPHRLGAKMLESAVNERRQNGLRRH